MHAILACISFHALLVVQGVPLNFNALLTLLLCYCSTMQTENTKTQLDNEKIPRLIGGFRDQGAFRLPQELRLSWIFVQMSALLVATVDQMFAILVAIVCQMFVLRLFAPACLRVAFRQIVATVY
jgi:hypothetical protein